ncbi:MAG TPA: hypothetical protein VF003_11905 [Pseudonocardiaceae bacterium]
MVLKFSGSAAYYGLFTFLSAYVLIPQQVNVSSATVPAFYLIGNLGALTSGFTVAVLIDQLGRTAVTRLSYRTASISVLLLMVSALAKSPRSDAGRAHALRVLRVRRPRDLLRDRRHRRASVGRRGGIKARGLSLHAVAPVAATA